MKVNVPHIEPLHSPEWVSMRPALENKPILRQAVVPHSTPGDDPAFYEYDNKTFLLPQVDQKQFNLWGLDPQRFIQDMMTTNPGRIKELSTSQIVEAAGRFAKLRFPGAHLGLDKQFIKQVRDKAILVWFWQLTKSSSVLHKELPLSRSMIMNGAP